MLHQLPVVDAAFHQVFRVVQGGGQIPRGRRGGPQHLCQLKRLGRVAGVKLGKIFRQRHGVRGRHKVVVVGDVFLPLQQLVDTALRRRCVRHCATLLNSRGTQQLALHTSNGDGLDATERQVLDAVVDGFRGVVGAAHVVQQLHHHFHSFDVQQVFSGRTVLVQVGQHAVKYLQLRMTRSPSGDTPAHRLRRRQTRRRRCRHRLQTANDAPALLDPGARGRRSWTMTGSGPARGLGPGCRAP